MNLLERPAEIKAAIAVMNPVARTAAQGLATYLLNHPSVVQDPNKLETAFTEHCLMAMRQSNWDMADAARIARFAEDHGEGVMNVALSIATYTAKHAAFKRKWGWVGKAAAFVAGAAVAAFFG